MGPQKGLPPTSDNGITSPHDALPELAPPLGSPAYWRRRNCVAERMITRMPPLRALATFEAAARNLSFQAAAAELNVTPSAVSQQIKVLEEFLALTLFKRLNRRILLTEAGELYYASIASAFGSMVEATERVHSHLN